ncbi:hypothetical protein AB0E01_28940 [Nocardia vinacea]|uniref:hypothetical protein n=1 Tax=Nocardia vinacea TaxID=96468 RepID=UPI0033DE629D
MTEPQDHQRNQAQGGDGSLDQQGAVDQRLTQTGKARQQRQRRADQYTDAEAEGRTAQRGGDILAECAVAEQVPAGLEHGPRRGQFAFVQQTEMDARRPCGQHQGHTEQSGERHRFAQSEPAQATSIHEPLIGPRYRHRGTR